jgi:peptide/nickel transport system substrate-binding protein
VRRIRTQLVLVAVMVLIAACGGDGATTTTTSEGEGPSAPSEGGVLVIAQSADPTGLHPNRFGSTNDRNIITNIYDTLVEFDLTSYEIVGNLATDWSTSEDGLVWTFNLRDDVVFHDGSEFGAEDVVASMGRAQEPEAGRTAPLLGRVVETVAVDDLTVEIRLSEPDRILLSTLVDVYISPRDTTIDLAETPVGTGPFKFVSWERNQQVEVEKNPDYWQEGLPHLDGVIYRTVPDGTVQSLQIRTGDVHVLADTPLGEIATLQQAGLRILTPPEGFNSGLYHFHINTRRDPWGSQELRQAVSHAVDRQSLSRSLFGFMQVLSNPMEANASFFNSNAASYNERDLETAQQLIQQAGFSGGVDGGEMIVCGLGFQFETLAQAVQNQLAEVGIDITISVLDVGTYVARTLGDDAGNFELALCAMVPKPDEYDLLSHPYNKLFTEALGWIDQKPEFYELLTEARSIASDEDYRNAILELQAMAMEGQPEIVLGGRLSPVTTAAGVDGLIAHTQGHLFLTSVSLSE